MADKKLELRVIAPTATESKELAPYKKGVSVDMVIMRCTTGDLGVLPGRMPCSMVLGTGDLRIFDNGNERRVAISGGVASVSNDVVTILTDFVEAV